MAIKISSTVVIDNSRQLLNITEADVTTDATINNAIKNQANVLRIYNSAGTEVRTMYCAATTPIAPT
jgi:hypothetical protein